MQWRSIWVGWDALCARCPLFFIFILGYLVPSQSRFLTLSLCRALRAPPVILRPRCPKHVPTCLNIVPGYELPRPRHHPPGRR
ncbi:hypothetical protein B0H14DRAFT_3050177 [Mycena olivaceomarginata]|nr:hypothetical protein B0H14DRAFT_3050177 [Mycena olivaceomarginata]